MTPIQLADIKRIADALAAECGDDEWTLACMIEGETNAFEAMEKVHQGILSDEELLEGIKARQDALNVRKGRLEMRRDAKRKALGQILRAANLKKAELVEATVSVRDGKAKIIVNDPTAVPANYQRVKREPAMAIIKEAFEGAETLPNWLSRQDASDVVTIRSK